MDSPTGLEIWLKKRMPGGESSALLDNLEQGTHSLPLSAQAQTDA